MKIARWAFTILLIAPLATVAAAQDQTSQDNSVAAAARRLQDQKKDQPKAAKVWDNDNMPSKPGAINVVGQEGTPAAPGTDANNAPADENSQMSAADKAALQGEIESAKQRIADLKADLDVMQRKYSLDQQTYLGKTTLITDKAGAAALASEKADLDAKQAQVADAEKALADLQAKLNAGGKDQSSQPPPANPPAK